MKADELDVLLFAWVLLIVDDLALAFIRWQIMRSRRLPWQIVRSRRLP